MCTIYSVHTLHFTASFCTSGWMLSAFINCTLHHEGIVCICVILNVMWTNQMKGKKNRSPLRSVQGYSYGMDGFLNQNNLKLCLHENIADKRSFFFFLLSLHLCIVWSIIFQFINAGKQKPVKNNRCVSHAMQMSNEVHHWLDSTHWN